MKVNLGPYKHWFGPYQVVEFLKYVGVSEETRDKIAEKYIPAAPFIWLEKLRGPRKEEVVIHRYDAWSADHTLAKIIAPLLRKVKEDKQGVPGEFLSKEYNDLVSSDEYWNDTDNGQFKTRANELFKDGENNWNAVLDHMIWAFEEYDNDNWDEKFWSGDVSDIKFERNEYGTHTLVNTRTCDWEKMQEGIGLFAKHFSSLWT